MMKIRASHVCVCCSWFFFLVWWGKERKGKEKKRGEREGRRLRQRKLDAVMKTFKFSCFGGVLEG